MFSLKLLAVTFLSASLPDASAAQANPAGELMITQSPDGTFTIQNESRDKNSKDSKVKQKLVIPPQVVVPIIPTKGKKPDPAPQQQSR